MNVLHTVLERETERERDKERETKRKRDRDTVDVTVDSAGWDDTHMRTEIGRRISPLIIRTSHLRQSPSWLS